MGILRVGDSFAAANANTRFHVLWERMQSCQLDPTLQPWKKGVLPQTNVTRYFSPLLCTEALNRQFVKGTRTILCLAWIQRHYPKSQQKFLVQPAARDYFRCRASWRRTKGGVKRHSRLPFVALFQDNDFENGGLS